MDRASAALVATEYHACERFALRALTKARAADDFERMSRIVLPLLEARRQIRHEAADAGHREVLSRFPADGPLRAGLYLVQPPLIGLEARTLREHFASKKVAAMIVAREPMTRDGLWPIVAVGQLNAFHAPDGRPRRTGPTDLLTVRVKVQPPAGVVSTIDQERPGITRDRMDGPPSAEWFAWASEMIGDHAIAQLKPEDPPAHRVDDLLEYLDAVPEHEKLHQRLAEECRKAASEIATGAAEAAAKPRRRVVGEDPWSF